MIRIPSIFAEALRLNDEVARVVDRVLHSAGWRRHFYSSKRQDRWAIQRVFREARDGFFVDIGAGDGRTHSNTFALERDYGWTGIAIEANPSFDEPLRKNRKCICVSACLSDKVETCDYFCFGHLGGLVANDADNSWGKRPTLLRRHADKIVRINCQTLEEVLLKADAPRQIQFLSIDIEGAEFRVLKDFPFHVFSFEAIAVERPTRKVHDLLSGAGYVLDQIFRHDGFYVSRRRAELIGTRVIPFQGMAEKPF
jgi:FkbM family methyltransferase